MPSVNCVVTTKISRSPRARQVEAIFDVPPREDETIKWRGDVPLTEKNWNVGLIVGPSGAGKSTVARQLFGSSYHPEFTWRETSVIDDVAQETPVADIAAAFNSVGFGTIPAWLRPHEVLSTGEKFRVDVARRLLELGDPIVVDEFTSVVDRQVAKVGSHAIQKYIRKHDRRFVAVTCHYDVEDWLQPDWVLEPSTMTFRWRSVQPRPKVDVSISRVKYDMWRLFAPFHYLTKDLNTSARCYCAFVDGMPTSFLGVIHLAHPRVRNLKRISRGVTLPDWQGLGLIFHLLDSVCGAYKAAGFRVRTFPAHPSLVRSCDRSASWSLKKRPGVYYQNNFKAPSRGWEKKQGGRPCAVFEYVGPKANPALVLT